MPGAAALEDAAVEEIEDQEHAEQPDLPLEDQEEFEEKDIDGWVWVDSDNETDSEPECEMPDVKPSLHKVKAAHNRDEFIQLAKAGLTDRPEGCTLGVHEGSQVWRSSCPGSKHFGRVWGGESGRTPRQALIRVLILMLQQFTESNPADKLAKKQLKRLQDAWNADPGKP